MSSETAADLWREEYEMIDLPDLESAARKHLPRFVFDFVAGGSGDEHALCNNVAALKAIKFVPRVLSGEGAPVTTVSLFGKEYAAPIGMLGLVRDGAECPIDDLGRCGKVPCTRG